MMHLRRTTPGWIKDQAISANSAKLALRRLASSAVSGRFVRRSRSASKRSNACFSDVLSDPSIEVLIAHADRIVFDALDVAAVLGAAFEFEKDSRNFLLCRLLAQADP